MKVLAVAASAKKDGNTVLLAAKVLETVEKEGIKTEWIQLGLRRKRKLCI